MNIEKTINYFQFKTIESNRPVDQRHVNELIAKIKVKNLLHLFPILVNSKMEVVDGQHRLAAAELLKEYVYYRIDDNISKTDIADLNALAKNWNINDYINYWVIEKAQGFDKLAEFMLDNPLLPASTVMMMLSTGQKRDINSLKRGSIDISNYDKALCIAARVKEFSEIVKFAYERNFVLTVMSTFHTESYDHETMKRKIELQPRSMVRCTTVRQYQEMFEEIYNYSQSSKNRLNFKR